MRAYSWFSDEPTDLRDSSSASLFAYRLRARNFCQHTCEVARASGIRMRREEMNGLVRILLRFPNGDVQSGAWLAEPMSAFVDACKLMGGRP